MKPKWQKLASLAQEICTLWFQFFCAVFASKGYPFKNLFEDNSSSSRTNVKNVERILLSLTSACKETPRTRMDKSQLRK